MGKVGPVVALGLTLALLAGCRGLQPDPGPDFVDGMIAAKQASMRAKQIELTLEEMDRRLDRISVEVHKLVEAQTKPIPARKAFRATVTAYTPFAESTGKRPGHPLFNRTASGFFGGGGICAADRAYWKFGTAIYIDGLGACVILDTGGAIKGRYRFDYYIPGTEKNAVEVARKWGRRVTWVRVLTYP